MSPTITIQQLEPDTNHDLRSDQVASRRAEYGPNKLMEMTSRGSWRILRERAKGTMVLLLVADAVSVFLYEYTDAVAIPAIVLLNAVLGLAQNYHAEKALAELKTLAVPVGHMRHEGVDDEISTKELVPGDIVLVEVSNSVSVDCRIPESVNLKTQEAALTGESAAADKQAEQVDSLDLPLRDRTNMVSMGAVATYGHRRVLVTTAGTNTELGSIATFRADREGGIDSAAKATVPAGAQPGHGPCC